MNLEMQMKYNKMHNSSNILIYRNIFTHRPRQLVAVLYDTSTHYFTIYLTNTANGLVSVKRISYRMTRRHLPQLKALIRLGLYRNIGQ